MISEVRASDAKRWFFAAAIFFLAVKLFWVLAPVPAMGVPRLGDDALTYLWIGSSTVLTPKHHLPAIQDILSIRMLNDQPEKAADFQRARVTMRTTSIQSSPWMMMNGAALATGLNAKYAFALVETVTAITLAVCIALSLSALFGYSAAAWSLLLLTFAILPNQGLHYLVTSVFTMALSLLLWTKVAKGERSFLPLLALTALILLSHPIGKVYVLIAIATLVGKAVFEKSSNHDRVIQFGAILTGIIVWQLIERLSGAEAAPTSGMGGLDVSQIGNNLQGYLDWCKTLLNKQPVLFLLSLAGLLVVFISPKRDSGVTLLMFVLVCAMLSTVIIDLPGYPGELPSRILIPVIILSLGAATQWIIAKLGESAQFKRMAIFMAAVVVVSQFPYFYSYLYANLNYRDSGYHVIDEASLKREIDRLPSDSTILWAETDVALMSGLLNGAGRFPAIPLPMLQNKASLDTRLENNRTAILATTVTPYLNGLSMLGMHTLEKRYYGYGFNVFRKIRVHLPFSVASGIFIRLSDGDPSDLVIRPQGGDGNCSVKAAHVAESRSHWVEIDKCSDMGNIEIASNNPKLKITGLSIAQPDERRRWPWGADGIEVTAHPIQKNKKGFVVNFSWQSLLGRKTMELLSNKMDGAELISDESGLAFIKLHDSSTTIASAENPY